MRRSSVLTMLGMVALLAATVPWQRTEGAEPIKIGFLAPYAGVFAKYGTDMKNGFQLYLDLVGNKAGGRPIVLVNEDSEGKPEVGLVKARKLVEKDHVHLLSGIISSGVAYAVRDYVIAKKTPLVISNAGATKLTQDLRSPFIFRTSFANGQQDAAGGWYAHAKLGARKVVVLGADYAAGHEKAAGFTKAFTQMGGEVLAEIYTPLGTADYAPYLAKLAAFAGKADRLWVFLGGSDAVRFINQYDEYGLKPKLKIFAEAGVVDEVNLPSQKDAALGVEGYMHYASTLDFAENRRLTQEYRKKYKDDAGVVVEAGYTSAKAIVAALTAVEGRIENQDAFLRALRAVKFDAPRGPFRFDEHQNAIENVYILRVEKREGRYNNFVIDTIADVDQYWTPRK